MEESYLSGKTIISVMWPIPLWYRISGGSSNENAGMISWQTKKQAIMCTNVKETTNKWLRMQVWKYWKFLGQINQIQVFMFRSSVTDFFRRVSQASSPANFSSFLRQHIIYWINEERIASECSYNCFSSFVSPF